MILWWTEFTCLRTFFAISLATKEPYMWIIFSNDGCRFILLWSKLSIIVPHVVTASDTWMCQSEGTHMHTQAILLNCLLCWRKLYHCITDELCDENISYKMWINAVNIQCSTFLIDRSSHQLVTKVVEFEKVTLQGLLRMEVCGVVTFYIDGAAMPRKPTFRLSYCCIWQL